MDSRVRDAISSALLQPSAVYALWVYVVPAVRLLSAWQVSSAVGAVRFSHQSPP